MTRVCKKCGVEKELNAENFRPHISTDGFRHGCRACEVLIRADWREKNPDKNSEYARRWAKENPGRHASNKKAWRANNPRKARSSVLFRTYGITLEDYERFLEKQNGGCAICGAETADASGRRLHVDHCHSTGRVRGLLCRDCNTILGYSNDQIEILQRAISYLQSH